MPIHLYPRKNVARQSDYVRFLRTEQVRIRSQVQKYTPHARF